MIPVLTQSGSRRRMVAAAAPPAGYSDAFTGADNTALATHDANWGDCGAMPVSRFKITSNRCVATAWNSAGARYTASSSDISQCLLIGAAAIGGFRQPAVRAGASTLGYALKLDAASGTTYTRAAVLKNGAFLAYAATTLSIDATADHTVRIEASGTTTVTIKVYVDGVQAGSDVTDSSSPIGAGNPGFYYTGANSPAGYLIDDWQDY